MVNVRTASNEPEDIRGPLRIQLECLKQAESAAGRGRPVGNILISYTNHHFAFSETFSIYVNSFDLYDILGFYYPILQKRNVKNGEFRVFPKIILLSNDDLGLESETYVS